MRRHLLWHTHRVYAVCVSSASNYPLTGSHPSPNAGGPSRPLPV
jgi:hypothetical protein